MVALLLVIPSIHILLNSYKGKNYFTFKNGVFFINDVVPRERSVIDKDDLSITVTALYGLSQLD